MPGLTGKWSERALWTGLLLFGLALALRIVFLQSLPEATGPFNPYYTGDTATWLDYASAIQGGRAFDLGLPMRPPGVAYLAALLWDGKESGLWFLQMAWTLMGAAVVALFFLAALRSFGLLVATFAAFAAAASSGLIILSTSLNNEIPYLLLVLASFTLWQPLRRRPQWRVLVLWATLQGLACLVRAEHLLFVALVSAYLAWAWTRLPGREGTVKKSLGRTVLILAVFTLPLVPWQLHIFSQIERFNQQPLPANSATEQAYLELEQALAWLPWTDEAKQQREALPAFSRRPMSNFVAATIALRGGKEVTGESLQVIEQAFGSRPGPIDPTAFITIYGGLNFHLANNPQATGGFSRAPLEAPPPLSGGPLRYPGFLTMGLPPPDLAFSYPPHVHIVNHGYRLGWEWMLSNPADYLALAVGKIRIFWAGMTMGYTGYNLPLGLSGTRRPVDLVVPAGGAGVALWRWAGLAVLLAGLWAGRRREALVPWLLLLATKVIATLGFFGYAREGAVVIPVFALALGLLIESARARFTGPASRSRITPGNAKWMVSCCVAALLLVTVEGARWLSGPVVTLDGQEAGAKGPYPGLDYRERRLHVK